MYRLYRKKNQVLLLVAILLILFGCYAIAKYCADTWLQETVADKVLRFHVLAESDSAEDQRRKLLVRDAVGTWVCENARDCGSRQELERLLTDRLDEICDEAERVLEEDGRRQPVTVRLANVEFPEKEYGDYSFPAGAYRALQVVIGSGQGHNWWCVLYPNLCFSGEGYDVTGSGARQELSRVLSPAEYESILREHRYRLGFRWLCASK